MSERAIVEMVEKMRERSSAGDGITFLTAKVIGVSPITIRTGNATIDKNIYLNPAYMIGAKSGMEKLEELFAASPGSTELFDFLKNFHENYMLKEGDTVMVIQSGVSFYMIGKAG